RSFHTVWNSPRKVCAPNLLEEAALFEILGVRVVDDLLSFLAHVGALLARKLDNSPDGSFWNYQPTVYQQLCVGVICRLQRVGVCQSQLLAYGGLALVWILLDKMNRFG